MIQIAVKKALGSFRIDIDQSSNSRTLGLLGPSGSGKSTLLHCIAGLIRPEVGRIVLDDKTLTDTVDGLAVPPPQRGIGYVFQDGLVFPHRTVEGNLNYGRGAHGAAPTLDEVVDVLDLRALLKRSPENLSGGEARRVAIGRALLSGPRILLLDEPLAGLDRALALKTMFYVQRMVQTFQTPMVYVSHTLSDVLYLCDEVWVLEKGRVVAEGPARKVISSAGCRAASDEENLSTVLEARRDASSESGAAIYQAGNLRLVCAPDSAKPGEAALISVNANDIIIARERPSRISARNVISGKVTTVEQAGDRVLLGLCVDPSCADWLVRLTPASITELGVAEGVEVYAIIKATSLRAVPIQVKSA